MRPYRLVGLGHRPFTAKTGVRIPLGTPFSLLKSSIGTASMKGINLKENLKRKKQRLSLFADPSLHF